MLPHGLSTGPHNLITDVAGIGIGNRHDEHLRSGVTVAVFDRPATAAVSVLGGAPGTRDTDALALQSVVETADAVVLSGGSSFGLDAASGAQAALREAGRGFAMGTARIPIVPSAICFDLMNGGDKAWGRFPPYRELAYEATNAATGGRFELGSVGGGYGATTSGLRGGLGSASVVTRSGVTVGALVVVNALGSAVVGAGPHFWAAPFEAGSEFGGLGMPAHLTPDMLSLRWKGGATRATTIALVACDAALTQAMTQRLAIAAHGGLAKGLRLAHALYDGDTVFAAATGRRTPADPPQDLIEICALASDCLARAIARAVYEAAATPAGAPMPPAWREMFGS